MTFLQDLLIFGTLEKSHLTISRLGYFVQYRWGEGYPPPPIIFSFRVEIEECDTCPLSNFQRLLTVMVRV